MLKKSKKRKFLEKKKLFRNSIYFILFSCLLLFGIAGFKQYKVYAAHGNPSDPGYIEYKGYDTIYLDDSGNFIYQTLDKKKESSLHYKTIGFTFSRIKRGIGNPKTSSDPYVGGRNSRETVLCPLNDQDAVYSSYEYSVGGTTWIVSNWVMSYDFVTGCLKEDPVWWAEIEDMMANNEEIYIGCDAILTTCSDATDASGNIVHKASGIFWHGRLVGKAWDYTNYQELFGIFSSAKNIASIKDHYDKFFLLNGKPMEPDKDEDSDYIFIKKKTKPDSQNAGVSQVKDASPDTYTYNVSDKFDLGTAIPTTENYQNTVELDPWYGRFVLRHKKFSKTSKFPVSITFQWYTYTPKEVPNEDGHGTHTEYTQVTHTGSYTNVISYTREAEYWMITDASFYELLSSNVSWDFPADYTYTGEIEQTVPFSITYNGTSWSTGTQMNASSVIYDKDDYYDGDSFVSAEHCGHAKIPELDTTLYSLDLGVVADEAAGEAAADQAAEAEVKRRTEGKDIKTTNDTLTLNGVQYLTENGMLYANDSTVLRQALASNGGYEIEQGVADTVTASTTITIPEKTANDNYPTSLDTTYNAFMFNNGMKGNKPLSEDFSIEGSEEKKNIKEGYKQNEPIKVHSPVFAPISIDDSGSAKQAITRGANGYNADGSVNWYPQLNPDGTYTVKFDWDSYFKNKYGDSYGAPAGWTQYVEKKQVAFPFTVEYNNVIYEPEAATGLTAWIDVDPDGTKTEFTIYIPSWAKEGIYGENGTAPIKVKCYANNYVLGTQEAEHYKENDEPSVGDPDHKQYYVAVYDYPVQVTGVMYDFTVTGINDEIIFGGLDEESTGVWNFVDQNTEHKVGAYNRFNIPVVNSTYAETAEFYDRTIFPGNDAAHTWLHTLQNREYRETQYASITKQKPLAIQNWSETDTLPFTTGKSDVSSMMGELALGHTIGFQLKTISDMASESENDSIKIIPTYRYVGMDGNVKGSNEIKLYTFDKKNGYVEFGNTQYQENGETSLADLYFADSYDTEWVKYTALKRGTTKTGILSNTVSDAYNTAGINIKTGNMLYSGDTLQLRVNEQKDDKDKVEYGTVADEAYPSLTVLQENKFKESMQTWYGEYNIPKSTKVMDVSKFLSYCDREGFYDIAENQYGCARDALTVDQLFDTVFGYGLTGDEEWWITDGYLILNFDITALKNGTEYMSYYKKYDMWSAEAGTWGTPHGERTITITNPDYSTVSTKIYDGDIAVISLSESSNLKNRVKTNVNLID